MKRLYGVSVAAGVIVASGLLAGPLSPGSSDQGESQRPKSVYRSHEVQALVGGASADIQITEPRALQDDIDVLYDLRRGDLLALGLRPPTYERFGKVIKVIYTLPPGPRRDAVVAALGDSKVTEIFARIRTGGEEEAARERLAWEFSEVVWGVQRDNGFKADFDGKKPESIQAVLDSLRQKQRADLSAATQPAPDTF